MGGNFQVTDGTQIMSHPFYSQQKLNSKIKHLKEIRG